jgi:hypothetical protein
MLTWEYSDRFDQHWLLLDGEHVAMVHRGVQGQFLVMVNRQRPMALTRQASAVSVEHGKRMAERWATANLPRLEVEVADRIAKRPKHRV